MKILCISDDEIYDLWDGWTSKSAEKYSDIDLVISAGDLRAKYLEFIVTVLNVPLLYVRGNHDDMYEFEPPQGCICLEDKIVTVEQFSNGSCRVKDPEPFLAGLVHKISDRFSGVDPNRYGKPIKTIRIGGLGGSIRYGKRRDMYTEEEMTSRARRMRFNAKRGGGLDIFVSHAPARGHGDLEDYAHHGFSCFNDLLMDLKPKYHLYGHVHMAYAIFDREMDHPSGTKQINVSNIYTLEI